MIFRSALLIAVLMVTASAERPHRGPKVGGHVTRQQFGTYVPRPVTADQPMAPQQVVYQPQPIQYVQQPLQYALQQHQYGPVQYVPQYQPQQPIQYQPQAVQYAPVVQQYKPTKIFNEKPESRFEEPKKTSEEVTQSIIETEDPEDQKRIESVLRSAPSRAILFSARDDSGNELLNKLPSNSTTIRAKHLIRDTFRCNNKAYGYYADVDNDCQIFHVCHPVHKIPYPTLLKGQQPPPEVTYQYSFICPKWTIFAQDVMTCAWATEAIPCQKAAAIADVVNSIFFKDVKKTKSSQEAADFGMPR